jgi:hypothetical protein
MRNDKLVLFLRDYYEAKHEWSKGSMDDVTLWDYLESEDIITIADRDKHRWYTMETRIVLVDKKYIGYSYAVIAGEEMGMKT